MRYPGPVTLPIVVPRCPRLDPGAPCYVPDQPKSLIWAALIVGAILMIPEARLSHLSRSRKQDMGMGGLGAISQQEMFPLRRELVLKAQDPAKSQGRLDVCLERRGWKMNRVRQLQSSIANKMTPDMFTGKTGKLTGGEKQLQEEIDKCLQRMKKGLAGETANCGVWQEVYSPYYGKTVARCLKYGPRCDPPVKAISPLTQKERQAMLKAAREPPTESKKPYKKERARVKKLLKQGPLHIDEIRRLTGWKPYKVSAVLVTMELQGEARQSVGKMFSLRGAGSLGGLLRTCLGYKRVKTKKNPKGVMRCSEYAPTATAKACLPKPMPPPEPEPEPEISKSDVNSIARALAADANAMEKEAGPALAREIISRGGIAPHAKGREKEEYKGLPLVLKRKAGLPMDEMASEMGVDESTLSRMIDKTYGTGKVKRRFTAKEFEAAAYRILEEEFYGPSLALAGPIMTCVEFYGSGRCKKFAPTCAPPGIKCVTETARFEPGIPKTRKAPAPKKPKRPKPKKRKPRPYLGPKANAKTFHEGELESAFNAAQRMIRDDPLYITDANGGYNIQASKPRTARSRLIVYPDGDVEEEILQAGDAYRAKDAVWIRRRHRWSARNL